MKTIVKIKFILSVTIACQFAAFTQDIKQTIRGTVTDNATKTPLIAATIAIYHDSTLIDGAITDIDGHYRINNIPVGRYTLVASYIGYRQSIQSDVVLNSANEVILPFEMEESPLEVEELTVIASGNKGKALNRMATVSARAFSAEESERYAGSRGDPARMAANFAGVQGNDDSNNDLVIRGNSPLGVLWRMEGVNIPNPNHFGVAGTTGGPVSILNNKVLAISDFMTGAFPAEFGNSLAGVFDLRMRNGNNEKHEFSGQLGFLGTELMAEGPISMKNKSSYLAAYRYSTLEIFHVMGINIGTDAVPKYQDLSFKLNFPMKAQGNISLFGMGGISSIDIINSKQTDPGKNMVYGEDAMDEHFKTNMGILGLNYSKSFGSKSFVKFTLSASKDHQSNHLDKIYRHIESGMYINDSMCTPHTSYRFDQIKYSAYFFFNKKINRQHSLRTGIISDLYAFDLVDSIFNESYRNYLTRLDYEGYGYLFQPYIQWKYKTSDKLTLTTGLHGQILMLEEHINKALEPRLGIKYNISRKHSLSYGIGLHSQMMPSYIYFARIVDDHGKFVLPNRDLDFSKSLHNVLSWDYFLNSNLRMKFETYFQYLYNIPVEYNPSSYSVIDEGHNLSRFFPDSLINKGIGNNYGIEFTLEKFFSKSYFFMLTASLYDSKRTGSDEINYHTIFNGKYILNLLTSKEFTWGSKKSSSFTIGGKMTLAGGKRYTPIDIPASDIAGEAMYIDSERNSLQFNPYFRADISFKYRINAKNTCHEIGLDLVNISGRKNVLKQTYISGNIPPVIEEYQLGFLPIFYYRINF
jgi:hypothetical protein